MKPNHAHYLQFSIAFLASAVVLIVWLTTEAAWLAVPSMPLALFLLYAMLTLPVKHRMLRFQQPVSAVRILLWLAFWPAALVEILLTPRAWRTAFWTIIAFCQHCWKRARSGGAREQDARCPSCGALVKASDIRSEPQAYGSAIELFDSQRPVGSATITSRGSKESRPRPYTLGMCSNCDPARNGALEKWEAEQEAEETRAREAADQEARERQERWAREDAARKGEES